MMGTEVGIRFTESEADCLADTLPHWPNFPYVTEILSAAKTCYKLAQISNVYDDLFAGTAGTAGTAEAPDVDFDAVVTAEQAPGYEPMLYNFNLAAALMRVEKEA